MMYKLSFTHCIVPNCFLIFQLKPEREPYKSASISLLSRLDRKKVNNIKCIKLILTSFLLCCLPSSVSCFQSPVSTLLFFGQKQEGKKEKKKVFVKNIS